MELYGINRQDLRAAAKYARLTSARTGWPFLYHWFDCLVCAVFHGCGASQYYEGFYRLRPFDRAKTYTRKRIDRVRARYGDPKFGYLLKDKVAFNTRFSGFIGREWLNCKTASEADIRAFVERIGRIMVKPTRESCGSGVHELDKSRFESELPDLAGADYLLEEYIDQHPAMCFGNKSVNTVRITTILDHAGVFHVVTAAVRCGIGNAVVDNYSQGGVVYPLNVEYGRIEGPGSTRDLGPVVEVQPGTDVFMVGREVPCWKETLQLVEAAARHIPEIGFVGWDVAISKNGPLLVEGNQRPSASLMENQGTKRGLYREMMSYV